MAVLLREALHSDLPFLREMLYEAVYWRAIANATNLPIEEGLADPNVGRALANWGERDRDTAVVALVDSNPVGAAWYRFYTDDNSIRGHIDATTPVLVIAVHRDYRRRGIGDKMVHWLIDHAARQGIPEISLMVSKDNPAIWLYGGCGFQEYADQGDSVLMLRGMHEET